MSQNTRCDVRKCLFGIHTMADNILWFKFPKNRQKWPSISTFKRRERTQDEWRHRRLTSLACSRSRPGSRPSSVGPLLFIASGKILQLCILQYLQRNDGVRYCTIFGRLRKFSFCKIYTVFVGNLFYRSAHKKTPYAFWKASKTSKTFISKRGH